MRGRRMVPGMASKNERIDRSEREVRVVILAPGHLSLTEIAEMFWDKLDHPGSVFTVDSIAVSTMLRRDVREQDA